MTDEPEPALGPNYGSNTPVPPPAGLQRTREVEEAAAGTERLFEVPANKPREIRDLFDQYTVPPFTVLDRRQGYWRTRVRRYEGMGIQSELGRPGAGGAWASIGSIVNNPQFYSGVQTLTDGMSIFDPVLCELTYEWFCPAGGLVLDPFAGGSVRGVVAATGGRNYIGIDLSEAQCVSNREQAHRIFDPNDAEHPMPIWVRGDSLKMLWQAKDLDIEPDLIFTCPPYGDLEVYSDDPADLSNMGEDEFDNAYRQIIAGAAERLKPDRFFAIVVGNYRNRDGGLRDLVGLTVQAAEAKEVDLAYYNEAVILDPIGTAAIRAPRQFSAQRKLVRTHQQLLVFVKGDPKVATQAIEPAREEIPNGGSTD